MIMGAKNVAAFKEVRNERFSSACCVVSITAGLRSPSILAFARERERDLIRRDLPWGEQRSSQSSGIQARVHASWTFHRSRFQAWETQVSNSTPTHTASKDRRLLLFRVTAEWGEGCVNALGFKSTARTRRFNGHCRLNDSDEAKKHHKKLRPVFV